MHKSFFLLVIVLLLSLASAHISGSTHKHLLNPQTNVCEAVYPTGGPATYPTWPSCLIIDGDTLTTPRVIVGDGNPCELAAGCSENRQIELLYIQEWPNNQPLSDVALLQRQGIRDFCQLISGNPNSGSCRIITQEDQTQPGPIPPYIDNLRSRESREVSQWIVGNFQNQLGKNFITQEQLMGEDDPLDLLAIEIGRHVGSQEALRQDQAYIEGIRSSILPLVISHDLLEEYGRVDGALLNQQLKFFQTVP